MASFDELSTRIGDGKSKIDEAVSIVAAAKVTADEMTSTFQSLDAEGQAASTSAISDQLGQAVNALTAVGGQLEATNGSAQAARQGLSAAQALPASAPSSPSKPFRPMRTDPGKRDEIMPYLDRDTAFATLWDSDGNRVVGVHSADDDGPAATATWKAPWATFPRLRRHVEAHAAARYKPGEKRQMAMYINLPPCSYSDGCKLNVADLLPKGSILWVHQVQPGGGVRVHKFEGTGRALDDDQQ